MALNHNFLHFIKTKHELFSGTPIPIHVWASSLVEDGILPILKDKGFTLSVPPETLTNCLLNYMFLMNEAKFHGKITKYRCKHELTIRFLMDQFEYFHQLEMGPDVWNHLKHKFQICYLADQEDYAYRLWLELPHIVFSHLKLEGSEANRRLENMLRVYDEDEEDDSESDSTETTTLP
uniref:Uncharacterized protein n=1 Tax=viral metagenome TaxID=1070528 RepID=A0A6C0ANZ2_9ZZZZ